MCGLTTTREDGQALLQGRPTGTFLLRLSSRQGSLAVMYVRPDQQASQLMRAQDCMLRACRESRGTMRRLSGVLVVAEQLFVSMDIIVIIPSRKCWCGNAASGSGSEFCAKGTLPMTRGSNISSVISATECHGLPARFSRMWVCARVDSSCFHDGMSLACREPISFCVFLDVSCLTYDTPRAHLSYDPTEPFPSCVFTATQHPNVFCPIIVWADWEHFDKGAGELKRYKRVRSGLRAGNTRRQPEEFDLEHPTVDAFVSGHSQARGARLGKIAFASFVCLHSSIVSFVRSSAHSNVWFLRSLVSTE